MEFDEQSLGMAGIAFIGVAGICAIIFGDASKTTDIIAFATAISGMIAALVRGGVGGVST